MQPLLGLSACTKLNLIKKVDIVRFRNESDFVSYNSDVFNGLGSFHEKCTINIDESIKPVVNPPRRILLCVKPKLKKI